MKSLKRWSRSKTPISNHLLQSKLHRLDALQIDLIASTVEEAKQLKWDISCIYEKLHLKWKQRSKIQWFQQGDRNTKFYHLCASQRRMRNKIL